MRDLRPLFEPRSVAVLGASSDPAKWGQWISQGALRGAHRRDVWLVNRGGGEILLTSIDRDGTKIGFDCELTAAVSRAVSIPVIASGGAGSLAHFVEVFTTGCADAALAASIFHYAETSVRGLKQYLAAAGIPMRL